MAAKCGRPPRAKPRQRQERSGQPSGRPSDWGQRVDRTNLTVAVAAERWLQRSTGNSGPWQAVTYQRYERIVRHSIVVSLDPTQAPIGSIKLRRLTLDMVAAWSKTNERHLTPTTARTALTVLNQVCRYAFRQGWLAHNPVVTLEPGEKPRWTPQAVRALDGPDLARLLGHSGSHEALFEVMASTGLRIGEALGLR